MTASTVNGRNGSEPRAGARTLDLLAAPLNSPLLRALQKGPKQQAALRREVGNPAQTTLRSQLKKLCAAGVLEKRRRNRFPGVLEYELTEAGIELLAVGDVMQHWLADSPDGPLRLGDGSARAATRALTEAWSTAMLRVLAATPVTLTELDRVISSLNYPSLERRLAAMRIANLVEACEAAGPGTPYEVTEWARRGAAPLLAAARWERHHAPAATAPVDRRNVETLFLLAARLLAMPDSVSGSCRLTIELRDGETPRLAGLVIALREGRLLSCTTQPKGDPDAWATGTLSSWFAAMIDRDQASLELGGDGALGRALVDGMHDALFGVQVAN